MLGARSCSWICWPYPSSMIGVVLFCLIGLLNSCGSGCEIEIIALSPAKTILHPNESVEVVASVSDCGTAVNYVWTANNGTVPGGPTNHSSVTYVAPDDFSGKDVITVQVTDTEGRSATIQVSLFVVEDSLSEQETATPTPILKDTPTTSSDLDNASEDSTASPINTPAVKSTISFETFPFSTAIGYTSDLAFGDCNNDGYEDLAIAPAWGQPDHTTLTIYLNQNGQSFVSAQQIQEYGTSLAWGDVDGDGHLDLAVGSHIQANRIYRNTGNCWLELYWEEEEQHKTWAIALVDWDDDGDLDLAIGSDGTPNLIYENNDSIFSQTPVWTSPYSERTFSMAWSNWDGDKFPDLAVGNLGEANRLYHNVSASGDARNLVSVWTDPSENSWTRDVAWGDMNDDGYPDLAVANVLSGTEFVYVNNGSGTGGWVDYDNYWKSSLGERSYDVEWVDVNNDGFLDLSVAQGADDSGIVAPAHHTRIYCGDGVSLDPDPCWSTPDPGYAAAIDWADWDCDGDHDMALGNYGDKLVPEGIEPVADTLYKNMTIDLLNPTCSSE